MYTATLRCGSVLSYEARSFVPSRGDLVPCRGHGYCPVTDEGESGGAGGRAFGRRARPRAQYELLAWLRTSPVTTVHALKRQRFTMRMIALAEREGLVTLDPESGRVVVLEASDS
jgi:hypothetical protein